jgi:hypothetical protein
MTLTQEQIKMLVLLGLDLPVGAEVTLNVTLPEIKKWSPARLDHGYFIETCGLNDIAAREVSNYDPYYHSEIGNLFKEKNDALTAINDIESYLRLSAWLRENDDGWRADWKTYSDKKYFIYYNFGFQRWQYTYISHNKTPGVVYMSQCNAEKLCTLINDGVVDIEYHSNEVN